MNIVTKYLHWILAGACGLLILGSAMRPPKEEGRVDLTKFRKVPVVDRGRIKPVDTAARNALRVLSGEDTFTDAAGNQRSALEWFMEVASTEHLRDSPVWKYKVFRIPNDQLLYMLELKPRSGFRYSLDEFSGKWDKIQKEAKRVQDLMDEGREVDAFDRHVLRLRENLEEFLKVAQHYGPLVVPPSGEDDWRSLNQIVEPVVETLPSDDVQEMKFAIISNNLRRRGVSEDEVRKLTTRQQQQIMAEAEHDLQQAAVTAVMKDKPAGPFEEGVVRAMNEKSPAAKAWVEMLKAYRRSDRDGFSKALSDYQQIQGSALSPTEQKRAKVEEWFNRSALFYWATGLYVIGAILACASWLGYYPETMRRTAGSVILITFVVHFIGLGIRMYLQGRPPVTNLYSSAIFIGLGCVYIGMILEELFPIGVGNLVGGTLGFLTTIVAHNLGSDRDTLEMMQAVLDTNFWLATHVTMVTIGYVSTFVAGFLGMTFILRGVLTSSLNERVFTAITKMTYGVVCFAMFSSFTGTVLGGIWADQSWGRFWGWDSKENGAVLVVIWNAIILHARWGGLIKQRGLAILACGGSIVTAWSWFGTNMLGTGLHSYGFMDAAAPWLIGFWVSQLAIMGLGLVPAPSWKSFGRVADAGRAAVTGS